MSTLSPSIPAIVNTVTKPRIETSHLSTRPETLDDIVGLDAIKKLIHYQIMGSKNRDIPYKHLVLSGPPGVGKTTIAHIVSRLSSGNVIRIMGCDISSPQDVYDLIATCKDHDTVLIEECHTIKNRAATILLPIMEEQLIVGGVGGSQPAPKVCFIFSTTNAGKLHSALLNRCQTINLDYYSVDEIKIMIKRAASINKVLIEDDEALTLLARSSRGTPRTAIEQRLESVLNVMSVDQIPFSMAAVRKSLQMSGINDYGLDSADINYCNELIKISESTGGRPVSLNSLCQSTGYSFDVVVSIIEAYLIKMGIVKVMTKGRVLTDKGYEILNKPRPEPLPVAAPTSVNVQNFRPAASVNAQEIVDFVKSGKARTLREICVHFNLRYGVDNPFISHILKSVGYDVRRHVGIVKIEKEV